MPVMSRISSCWYCARILAIHAVCVRLEPELAAAGPGRAELVVECACQRCAHEGLNKVGSRCSKPGPQPVSDVSAPFFESNSAASAASVDSTDPVPGAGSLCHGGVTPSRWDERDDKAPEPELSRRGWQRPRLPRPIGLARAAPIGPVWSCSQRGRRGRSRRALWSGRQRSAVTGPAASGPGLAAPARRRPGGPGSAEEQEADPWRCGICGSAGDVGLRGSGRTRG